MGTTERKSFMSVVIDDRKHDYGVRESFYVEYRRLSQNKIDIPQRESHIIDHHHLDRHNRRPNLPTNHPTCPPQHHPLRCQ